MSNPNLVQERVMNAMEKLNKIAAKQSGIVNAYQGETRDWWNLVDEDAIYKAIGEPAFDVYVRLFVTEDTHYPTQSDAA